MASGTDGRSWDGGGARTQQTMDMSDRPGGRNNGQSASEIFGEMPGSMSGNMNGSMNGNMSGGMAANTPWDMSGGMPANAMNSRAHISTPEETAMQQLDLSIGLPQDAIENPTSLLEARLGSLRALLSKLVGHYVIVTFLIGTQNSISWEGFLYNVGNDYIVIFQPDNGRYVTGDMFSLKFVEFYEEKGVIPACIGSRRRDAQNMW
ncbi:MAG: hypothetical protein E7445_07690 [Ruminococcaceae bacterium]|nr:hypothetical protein [Oscillospiraceae bacterium]